MDLRPLFKAFENQEYIFEENLLQKCSPEMIKRAVDNGFIYLRDDIMIKGKGNCYSISNIGYKEEYKLMHRRPRIAGAIATVGTVIFVLNCLASGILLMCALGYQDWMFVLYGILTLFSGGLLGLLLNAIGLICEEIVRIRLILEENEHTSESTATSNTVIEHSSNPTLTETSTLPPSIQEALKKKRNG